MKILFFIEGLGPGGKERRLVELIKGLSEDKSITMGLALTKKKFHYEDVLSTDIDIYYAFKKGFRKQDPRIFLEFFKIAKVMKPDVIHVWGNTLAIYAIPAKVILKIPMINNQISDAPEQVSNSILSHRLTFPFSNKIVANSYAGLKAYKAPKSKSSVIYNGFDFSRISHLEDKDIIRKKFKIKTRYVVGMVASFSDKKDYETYIKAANKVLDLNSEVTFLCVGSGDNNRYRQMVAPQNTDKILFLGKQNNVENIMNICDIGVLATYTEGISNALLEFLALGKPVVTTFGGGNIELVKQDETGYLVPQKSSEKMAEKITLLLNDRPRRVSFGSKGKERIFKEFSIENMITKFKDVFIEVV